MTEHVTIEGSITPSTFLARGERTTVMRTPFIDKLIAKGFVVVADEPATKTVERRAETQRSAAVSERGLVDAPDYNAPRAQWAEFLDAQGVEYPKSAKKDTLVSRWEAASGTTVTRQQVAEQLSLDTDDDA